MNETEIYQMIQDSHLDKQESRDLVLMRGGDKVSRGGFTRMILVDEAGELKLEVYLSGYLSFILYTRMINSFEYLPKLKTLFLFLK